MRQEWAIGRSPSLVPGPTSRSRHLDLPDPVCRLSAMREWGREREREILFLFSDVVVISDYTTDCL